MNRCTILGLLLCLSLAVNAQKDTTNRLTLIANQLAKVSQENSKELARELAAIRKKVQDKTISAEDAEEMMSETNQFHNQRLERRINRLMAEMEEEITKLNDIDMEDIEDAEMRNRPEDMPPPPPAPPGKPRVTKLDDMDSEDGRSSDNDDDEDDDDDDNDDDDDDDKFDIWSKKKHKSEQRTTSQFVFAIGLNTLVDDAITTNFKNQDLKISNSRFYEFGLTAKTRIFKNSPFLQFKYGISANIQNLRPRNNTYFVRNADGNTKLAPYPGTMKEHEPYFRSVSWTVPLHLEFDFSKRNKTGDPNHVTSQQGIRVGIGGFAGLNSRIRQYVDAINENGDKVEVKYKNDYGLSDFVYGVSAYVGYKDASIYGRFNMNPYFDGQTNTQTNAAIGIRFDFH